MTTNPLYIGVDLGRSTRIALVDSDGLIISQERVPTDLSSGRALVDGLIAVINKIKGASSSPVVSVGIGLPGLIEHSTQQVRALPNLVDVSSIKVYEELRSIIGLPIIIDNDANVAAYGEWQCGAAKGARDFAYITLGTGIGGALIIGGQLQRGAHGFSGEFGHIKIGTDGLECSCGSIGCLETVASGPNIVRRTREKFFKEPRFTNSALFEKMSKKISCEDVVDAARTNDELARTVLSETAQYLGTAIANVVNLLNVEKVVLGGPVMSAGEFLLNAIKKETESCCFAPLFEGCSIVTAQLGNDAGLLGSAMLARDIVSTM
jgi:glucokinase